MQQVFQGLNPDGGPDFVSVYIDDVLVFSRTLEEHWQHLDLVMEQLKRAGLKLQPAKCHFIRTEVEYLGHIISPEGLKTNSNLVTAVREFPIPKDLKELRRFLGLSSYYRRFIPQFAQLAQPLHNLTREGVTFKWEESCQRAFESIKQKLVEAPVLSYPSFDRDFILETNANAKGLGAILSQEQEDGQVHPVAYASRALSPSERNYSITEMETLAVVWAISHFQFYLYGQSVTVYTDHTAVKAVLEAPNPTGKHARWWMKVHGQGIKEVRIVYRTGKSNIKADALSRSPHSLTPNEASETEVQVAAVMDGNKDDITTLLQADPVDKPTTALQEDQRRDPDLLELIRYMEEGILPADQQGARKLVLQAQTFVILDDILYYVDSKRGNQRLAVVPKQ